MHDLSWRFCGSMNGMQGHRSQCGLTILLTSQAHSMTMVSSVFDIFCLELLCLSSTRNACFHDTVYIGIVGANHVQVWPLHDHVIVH